MNVIRVAAMLVFALFGPNSLSSQAGASTSAATELEAAETRMFEGIRAHDPVFMKEGVSADFVSINADGTRQDKEQMISDSARAKMVGAATFKIFDRNIRVYGDVGIITGRARAYVNDKYVVEFLYTAVFVKQNDKWMYASWQGTISKDSPPPPPMPQ
jgi:Domain of unknown function (DUF4440)